MSTEADTQIRQRKQQGDLQEHPHDFIKDEKQDDSKTKASHRINIAPLNTPLHRRLETFSVMWHTVSIPFFCSLFCFLIYMGWVYWVCIILPYFIWFYGFDLHTPTTGKVVYRVRDWMRNLILWEWFVNYYPIKIHKTCELEPTFTTELVETEAPDDEADLISEDSRTFIDRFFKFFGLSKRLNDSDASNILPALDVDSSENDESNAVKRFRKLPGGPRYIFGYHPHGVISMGVMGLFATNAIRNQPFKPPSRFLRFLFHDTSKHKELFPGIGHIFPLTLTTQFTIPFLRDYLLALGLTSASAKNIKSIINNGDNSVCIVVGGAQESLLNDMVGQDMRVGIGYKGNCENEIASKRDKEKRQIKLVLRRRKGFVKLAIELGNVSLVPTFAFGEADVYRITKPKKGSIFDKFQGWLKRMFLFTLPFFSARGVFFYDFGFLPYRTPINICTGRPVYVPSGLLDEANKQDSDFKKEKKEESKPPVERLTSLTSLINLGKKKKPRRSRPHIPQHILDHYHGLYIEELKKLYYENKDKYGYGDVELEIIE